MRLLKFLFSRFFICILLIAALTAAIIFLCLYIHSLLPAAAAVALIYLLSSTAALFVLFSSAPESFACSWLAVIILLPVAGAALYVLSSLGDEGGEKKAQGIFDADYDGLFYYDCGATFLREMTGFIGRAERSVYLEFYIIAKGGIWDGLYSALIAAAERGADVRIIYDGLGSALRAPVKDFKRLKDAGVKIKAFNRLLPAPLSRLNFRDHRKIAVIDGEWVLVGGVNVADEYADLTRPHGVWRDGGACFTGNVAHAFQNIFLSSFGERTAVERTAAVKKAGGAKAVVVADGPYKKSGLCEDLLTQKIYSSLNRVFIFTPYLCLCEKLFDALCYAAGRGAEVKIIIPGIPDKRLTYSITRAYCARLAERGVQIYEYAPGFMHFKGAVCDGGALVGSYNMDFRSLRVNYECAVWADGELAENMTADFLRCIEECAPFDGKRRGMPAALARIFATLV